MAPPAFTDWLRSQPALVGSPPPFTLATAPNDPDDLFKQWIVGAAEAGVPEPHAATLSTVDAAGRPDARTLILKDVGPGGWAVAGLRTSAKGAQLAAYPGAALNFWWQPIRRAVRMRGTVREATTAESAADLAARSAAARADVDPADWVLWWIRPERVEFWQGAPDRRHTRLLYERDGRSWRRSTIAGETNAERKGSEDE